MYPETITLKSTRSLPRGLPEGDEFSVNVRMGQVETLLEAGWRGLGMWVFLSTRSASASNPAPEGLANLSQARWRGPE
jgi:hypothetical protein